MLYVVELAPIEQNIAQQAIRSGASIPDRIANAPQLKLGLGVFLQAFFDLDSERSHALALTPIPWSAINEYARTYGFDDEATDDLHYFIRCMDNEHLKRLDKKKPTPTSKVKKK